MYLDYYGLTEPPFSITPNPRFLYYGGKHREALNHMLYGIRERKGFVQITGEVGAGKSTLCRALLGQLGNNYSTALILNPILDADQLMRAIALEFGLDVRELDRLETLEQINLFLLRQVEEDRETVLIIDEAQNLSNNVLEQIRLLSNLETDKQKLLQIVLLGQPELKVVLAQAELRQLRQRILVHYELLPLAATDIAHYIQHRLSLAGGSGRPGFTTWAMRALHRGSGGIPRVLNNLCDKAMLSAFIRDSDEVNYWDVRRAVRDMKTLTA